jgi:hypothetical protein
MNQVDYKHVEVSEFATIFECPEGSVLDHSVLGLGSSFSKNTYRVSDLVFREMNFRGRERGERREHLGP